MAPERAHWGCRCVGPQSCLLGYLLYCRFFFCSLTLGLTTAIVRIFVGQAMLVVVFVWTTTMSCLPSWSLNSTRSVGIVTPPSFLRIQLFCRQISPKPSNY